MTTGRIIPHHRPQSECPQSFGAFGQAEGHPRSPTPDAVGAVDLDGLVQDPEGHPWGRHLDRGPAPGHDSAEGPPTLRVPPEDPSPPPPRNPPPSLPVAGGEELGLGADFEP